MMIPIFYFKIQLPFVIVNFLVVSRLIQVLHLQYVELSIPRNLNDLKKFYFTIIYILRKSSFDYTHTHTQAMCMQVIGWVREHLEVCAYERVCIQGNATGWVC